MILKRLFVCSILLTLIIYALSTDGCSKVKENKKWRIARDPTWYPWNLLGKEKNLLAFTDDLLVEIAKEEKLQIRFLLASSNPFEGLNNDSYDAVVSSLLPSVWNKQKYIFSDPYFFLGPVLVLPASSSDTSLEQLDGKVIGIQMGSSVVFDVQQFRTIIYVPYESILDALESLSNGRIDGVIMDVLPAQLYLSSFYQGKLKIASAPLTKEGFRLLSLLDEDHQEFIDHFNKGLKTLQDNGLYNALIDKWGLVNVQLSKSTLNTIEEEKDETTHH